MKLGYEYRDGDRLWIRTPRTYFKGYVTKLVGGSISITLIAFNIVFFHSLYLDFSLFPLSLLLYYMSIMAVLFGVISLWEWWEFNESIMYPYGILRKDIQEEVKNQFPELFQNKETIAQ